MKRYYSPSTHTTYLEGVAGAFMPEDVVEVSHAEWAAILAGENPPSRVDLEAKAWEAIKAERDRRVQHGGYLVGEHWFHSDTFSRTQQLGLVLLGAGMPLGIQWKTLSGQFVAMTPSLAQEVFAAAAANDIAIFGAAEAHRTAMMASADPSAYDFTGGWPPIFEEA